MVVVRAFPDSASVSKHCAIAATIAAGRDADAKTGATQLANRSAASCASVASSARHASSAASTSRFPTSRRNVSSKARSECARLCAVTGSFLPPNFFRVASATSAATNIARHAAREIGETAASTTATRSFRVDVGCAAHGVSARFVSTNRRHTVPAARRARGRTRAATPPPRGWTTTSSSGWTARRRRRASARPRRRREVRRPRRTPRRRTRTPRSGSDRRR